MFLSCLFQESLFTMLNEGLEAEDEVTYLRPGELDYDAVPLDRNDAFWTYDYCLLLIGALENLAFM